MTEHPADRWTREQIAAASSYAVYFLKGPHDRYREDAATLPEAEAIAARMNADHGRNGRRACIYAMTPNGPLPMGQPYKTQAMRADEAAAGRRQP
jgi:hypothetical protein